MKKILSNKISLVSNEDFWNIKNGTFYFGVDPTGPGLHIGHMLPISLCLDLLNLGFKGIILVGGFTGSVGDPTGKLNVRKTLDNKCIQNYTSGILGDLKNIFGNHVTFVNNKDWLSNMAVGDLMYFLKNFSINKKLNLEIFKTRLQQQNPLFMNEFLYPDLQAIDFWHLFKDFNCTIQVGGQDQWGNISYGVHTMNRMCDGQFFGCVTKLLESGGKKIGKTEGNCVFVRDHVEIYQQILQLADQDSEMLCHVFNIEKTIDPMENKHRLGEFIIKLYYKNDITKVQEAKEFANSVKNLTQGQNMVTIQTNSILEIVKNLNLLGSNSEIKRLFQQNAIYLNKEVITDKNQIIKPGKYLLSIGKKQHTWIEVK